jgi:hypothetical protein
VIHKIPCPQSIPLNHQSVPIFFRALPYTVPHPQDRAPLTIQGIFSRSISTYDRKSSDRGLKTHALVGRTAMEIRMRHQYDRRIFCFLVYTYTRIQLSKDISKVQWGHHTPDWLANAAHSKVIAAQLIDKIAAYRVLSRQANFRFRFGGVLFP